MNDARLDLRLPVELLDRVKEAAGDGSVNAWVRDALERALAPKGVKGSQVVNLRTDLRVRRNETPPRPLDATSPTDGKGKITRRLTPEGDVEEIPPTNAEPSLRGLNLRANDEIPLPKIAPRRWGR